MNTYLPLWVSPKVERSVASRATVIDWAVFVTTDLKKYTSYEDVIKKQYAAKWKL